MNALDLLYIIAGTLAAPAWARKPRSGLSERLGHVGGMLKSPSTTGSPSKPRILLHAVSVGEVNALRPLVPLLAERARVVVCTTTDTGLARAQQLFGQSAEVVRYPLDFSWAVKRFLNTVQPDAVGLVELELWPQFLGQCRKRGIPVCVINGRLSARSFKGYRRWRRVVRPLMFSRIVAAAVQDGAYAERFEAMGVANVSVTGSMKWDSFDVSKGPGGNSDGPSDGPSGGPSKAAMELGRAMGINPDRPLVVAGSTGPGEEALLHEAVNACGPGVQLVCAPRKPERFAEAAAQIPGSVRRSEAEKLGFPSGGESLTGGRFVLDTIGELGLLYQLADVVVVGRSFFDLYGSDPIEPIAMGKAVVIGPAVGDFEQIVGVFERVGGIQRANREDLGAVLGRLLADPGQRAGLAGRGLGCIREQQGAASEHAELLMSLCSESD